MAQLAAPMTLAASLAMVIAALRLWTQYDNVRGRHHIVVTLPLILYIFLSSLFFGAAALLPFLPYGVWPQSWRSFVTVDPLVVAVLAPLVVNGLIKLDGFDLPQAIGPLSKLGYDICESIKKAMVNEEYIVLRDLIDPFAEGANLHIVLREMLRSIPIMLADEKANAFRVALNGVKTVEEALELYIRHIGKSVFIKILAPRLNAAMRALAPTPLFDALERVA